MKNWKAMLTTIVTVFAAAAISAALAFNLDIANNWKAILIAGLTPVVTYIANLLNPGYANYGIRSR